MAIRSILAPLAAGSAIRLGLPVRRIEQTGDGVTVVGDGWSESGSHAVVTVPLGVLKSGTIEFVPPLPPQRQAIIDRSGFGNMEKVVLAFSEPFWRTRTPGCSTRSSTPPTAASRRLGRGTSGSPRR